jgi:chemotaxis protein MotB
VARKKKHGEHVNHERWLVSYADFITLLFAFFVVMFAASNSDQKKAGQIAHAVQSAFNELAVFEPSSKSAPIFKDGTPASSAFSVVQIMDKAVAITTDERALKSQLEETLKEELDAKLVRIKQDSRGVTLSLDEAGFFDPGSAAVKEAGLPVLQRIAEKLKQIPQNLRVEGHTDNTPIHTAQFPSNWELSTARATNVLQYLVTNAQIAPERLSAVGYGQYRPTATNDTPDGRTQNRRVDLVIIGMAAQKLEPTEGVVKPENH